VDNQAAPFLPVPLVIKLMEDCMENFRLTWVPFIAAVLLSACANQPYFQPQPTVASGTGVVDRIEVVDKGSSSDIAGTVIGGVIGGLVGHQIGGGSGQTAATVLGAAGGAVAGNEIAKRSRRPNETFRVTVHMDSGGYQVVTQDDITNLRTGDRVRINNGRIYRI